MRSEFKDHLVLMLSRLGFVRYDLTPERLAALSEKIGVLPDTLLAARELRRRREEALQSATGRFEEYHARRKSNQKKYFSLVIHMRRELKQIFVEFARERGVDPALLFRSVVHHYLRGSWEPETVYRAWPPINGKTLRGGREVVIHFSISLAAKEAFSLRADALCTKPSALLRTLIVDTFQGKFARVGTFRYVTQAQMYSEAEKYYLPFQEGEEQTP